MSARWLCSLCLVALPVLAGCGSRGDGRPVETEGEQVAQVVREFQDHTGSPKNFANAFAKGAAPAEAERKRYRKHGYAPAKANISGDTATMKVKVLDEAGEKLLGEADWSFVKEDGKWKVKAAPLP